MSEAAAKPRVIDLPTVVVPIARLRPNTYNPNKMSDAVAQAERESIEKFGFIDPITVRRPDDEPDMFEIIDGEHRWRIASELGYTDLPVIVLDVTEVEAKKLTIVLNETRGDADVVLLGQLLNELRDAAADPEDFMLALPYGSAEIDHLLSIGSLDWDQFAAGGGGNASGPRSEHTLELAFADAGTLARFKEWVDIVRRELELGDMSETDVVAEAVKRQALAMNQA